MSTATATAVLSTEIDTTAINQRIQEIDATISAFTKKKISPQFDIADVERQMALIKEKISGAMSQLPAPVIRPEIDVNSVEKKMARAIQKIQKYIETIDQTRAEADTAAKQAAQKILDQPKMKGMKGYAKEGEAAARITERLNKRIAKLGVTLREQAAENKKAGGQYAKDLTVQTQNSLKQVTKKTTQVRAAIKRDFSEIIEKVPTNLKLIEQQYSINRPSGFIRQYKPTKGELRGSLSMQQVKDGANAYKAALDVAAASYSALLQRLKKETPTATPIMQRLANKIREIGTAAKNIGAKAGKASGVWALKTGLGMVKWVAEGVKNKIIEVGSAAATMAKFAGKLSGMNLGKVIEWGQAKKAMVAEAEAAFSRESITRRIYSKIFADSKVSGYIAYQFGKYGEAIVAGANKLSSTAIKATFGAIKILSSGIGRLGGSVGKKISENVNKGLTVVSSAIRIPLSIIFKGLQKIINKYTLSVIVATASSLIKAAYRVVKRVFGVLKKLFTKVFGDLYGMVKRFLKGLLGMFGLSGGGGGVGLALGGFGLVALRVALVKMASDLETAMLNIATVTTQLGASLTAMRQKIIDLSNSFGKSAVDMAKSMYDVVSAGFRGKDAFLVLESALVSARAGMTDVKTSGTAISRLLNTWQLGAHKASMVSDVLFNTVRRGVTTFPRLAQQITRLAPMASAAGLSLREVGASIAYLTRSGQTTAQAITGLTSIMKSLVGPTDEAVKAVSTLGIEWGEAAVKQYGFIELMKRAAPVILANKQAFRKITGEVTGLNSALALAKDPIGLFKDFEGMQFVGSAAQAAGIVATGFAAQISKFWTSLGNILRNVGSVLLTITEPAFKYAIALSQKLSELINQDTGGFFIGLKNMFAGIFWASADVIAKLIKYLLAKAEKLANVLIAVLTGLWDSIGVLTKNAFVKLIWWLGKAAVGLLSRVWNIVGGSIKTGFNYIIESFKWHWQQTLEYFRSSTNPFVKFFHTIMKFVEITYDVIAYILGKIKDVFVWLGAEIGLDKAVTKSMKRVKKSIAKIDLEKDLKNVVDRFGKGYREQLDKELQNRDDSKITSELMSSFSKLTKTIVTATVKAENGSKEALKKQADSIRTVIKALSAQYSNELKNNSRERAAITKQFLDQEKDRLYQISKQLDTSALEKALKYRRGLYESLAKAQAQGNSEWYLRIIALMKKNESRILRLQKEADAKQAKLLKTSQRAQVDYYDQLRKRAMALVESGSKLTKGLTNLNQVLDNVFGKNVERIAKKYGVGQETATTRTLTRDIIEAKHAGFTKKELQKIMHRGMAFSDATYGQVSVMLSRSKQIQTVEQLKQMKLFNLIVKVLDRAEAFGMSREYREKILLRGKLSADVFKKLDEARGTDKQTQFIKQTIDHFKGIEEERALQERFNTAQVKLSELTKTSITRNQKFKETVEKLERTVVELEAQQKKGNAMAKAQIGNGG